MGRTMWRLAILEKEVCVVLNPRNIEYYESLNYHINRVKNKWGKFVVPKGTKILVKVEHLTEGSRTRVTKICDEENCKKHIPDQIFGTIIKNRKETDGKDRCKKCARNLASITRRNNVVYENSLEYFAEHNDMGYLLKEFSDTNSKKPHEISFGTKYEYLWNCPKCKSEYFMKVSDRTSSGINCPYCAGSRVNHTNCLWNTYPEVAKLLKDKQIGFEVTFGSNRKEIFCCDTCKLEKRVPIYRIVNQGFSCHCSDGISYSEKFMMGLLNQIEVKYITQKLFNWSQNKKYDFYIPSLNCIIETHGSQHYIQPSGNWGLLDEIQKNDELKKRIAKQNGIKHYVIIDCRQSNLQYVKNNIIESNLSHIFNFKGLEWEKIHEYSLNSLVKVVCDMWNDGVKGTKQIGEIVNLASGTVKEYLKKGKSLGWCDYNRKESKKYGILHGIKNTKEIIQLSLDGEFIKEWDSATKAGEILGILQGNISAACNGKYKSAGGYKWMHKDRYEIDKESIKTTKYGTKTAVVQLSLDGAYLNEFNSLTEAHKKTGINLGNISSVCRKEKYKSAGGFRWMYKDVYEENKSSLEFCETTSLNKKVVKLDLNNNFLMEYDSLTEASNTNGIRIGNISLVCSGKRKSAGGYKWMLKEDYNKYY